MPIVSPAGDPSDDKHLWWRCVFIAAAIQPVLILLSLVLRTTGFMIVLVILYFPCLLFTIQSGGASLPLLFILLPVCIALYSFILGSVIYFVCRLARNDY